MKSNNQTLFAKKACIGLLVLGLIIKPAGHCRAQTAASLIRYQGSLSHSGALVNGSTPMVLRLTSSDGSIEYWTSGSTRVAVTNGLFRYPLGTPNASAFEAIDWEQAAPYIELTVNGTLLLPREPLSSVPYSLSAKSLAPGATIQAPTLDMAGKPVTNLGTPSLGTDAANKAYVDSATMASGGVWRLSGTGAYNLNSGNVGVGTSSPAEKLSVAGTIQSTSGGFKFPDGSLQTTAAASWTEGLITSGHVVQTGSDPYFRTNADDKHIVLSGGSGWSSTGATMVLRGASAGWNAGGLELNGADGAVRNLIFNNLNVGIGMTNPSHRLAIAGAEIGSAAGFDKFATTNIELFTPHAPGAGDGVITLHHGGKVAHQLRYNEGNLFLEASARPGYGTTSAPNLLIGGNVGVGTTSPAEKLSVAGTIQSTSGGFKFPDGSLQTTAAGAASWAGITSKPPWMTNTNLIGDLSNANNSVPSGFYQAHNGPNYPTGGWYNLLNARHLNTANDHGFQITNQYGNEDFYTRSYSGGTGNNDGTFTSWRRLAREAGSYTFADLTLTGGVTSSGHVIQTGNDPYFRTNADDKHIVLSGGSGWSPTGATMVLRGASAGWNAGGLELNGADGAVRNLFFNNLNVGIGTSSPAEKLSVAGTIQSTSGGFKFPDGSLQTTAAASWTEGLTTSGHVVQTGGDPYFRTNADDKHIVLSGGSGWSPTGATMVLRGASAGWNAGGLEINGADGAVRNLIYNNLNVGIGTASPSSTLDVAGTIRATAVTIKTNLVLPVLTASDPQPTAAGSMWFAQ